MLRLAMEIIHGTETSGSTFKLVGVHIKGGLIQEKVDDPLRCQFVTNSLKRPPKIRTPVGQDPLPKSSLVTDRFYSSTDDAAGDSAVASSSSWSSSSRFVCC